MDERHTQTQDQIRTKRVIRIYIAIAVWVGVVAMYLALILPDYRSGSRSYRHYSRNHLKQFGLAFHNYYDVNKALPDEASGQSWETQLLPFLDQAPLYNAMDHDKPWNDPANSPHAQQALLVFLNPDFTVEYDRAGYALSHYAGNSQWLTPGAVRDLHGVPDGLSSTILAGEVADGFMPWAQPGNLRDPSLGINRGPTTFGHPRSRREVYFLMGDGSVKALREDIDPKVLKALATPAGGEVIPAKY